MNKTDLIEHIAKHADISKAAAGRVKPLRHINVAFGRELYHSRGCVACHAARGCGCVWARSTITRLPR